MTAATVNGFATSQKKLGVREIFFDFEGTLVDFQWNVSQAIEETLQALKERGFHRERFGENPTYATIFNSIQKRLEKEGGKGPLAAAAAVVDDIYDKYDADAGSRWGIYPDTIQMLEALAGLGFKMGLVSNIGRKALQATMDRLDLTRHLAVTVSRSVAARAGHRRRSRPRQVSWSNSLHGSIIVPLGCVSSFSRPSQNLEPLSRCHGHQM